MKLFIIFVNYNSGKQLFNGVEAVLKSRAVEGVVIVDNASSDESLTYLSRIQTNKKIIVKKNKTNAGFYKALNIAAKRAFAEGADSIMPLDFDLDFSFDFILRLSKVNADMVAPTLTSKMNGRWFYDYGGRVNFVLGKAYHRIKHVVDKKPSQVSTSLPKSKRKWIDFVSGGCTIIKKEVFEKCGYFDEDYFVYFGDMEYALRARENKFNVVMDGTTIVHHKLEITSQTKNFRKMKIALFDNITFINKRVNWFYRPLAYSYLFFSGLKVLVRTFS